MNEDGFLSALATAREDLNELKLKQGFTSDSLKLYGLSSTYPWDLQATLAQNEYSRFRITFLYDHSQNYAISQMSYFYRLGNENVMQDPVTRHPATNPNIEVAVHKLEDQATLSRWELIMRNTSAVAASYTGYAKLFFAGTDRGSFIIDVI